MLGESIRRRRETSRRWLPYVAAAGWISFTLLLLLYFGMRLQHTRYQRQVATEFVRYQRQVESQVRFAMLRADELERELATCNLPRSDGGLLAGLLPALLEATLGIPPGLSRGVQELVN